jgi:predicted kinase
MDSRSGDHPGLCLVLMAGLPGTGKSTLARAMGTVLGWPVIDKDVIVTSLLESGIAEDIAQPASYGVMFALGLDMLRSQHRSVILDSPAGQPVSTVQARKVARQGAATLTCILCLADRETRNHRVANRSALRSQPIRVSRTAGDGRERFAHLPDDTLLVDTTGTLDGALRIVLAHIAQLMSGGNR